MVQGRRPQPALELLHQLGRALDILEGGDGGQEIARIGQAVGADGPKLRQAEAGAIVLADIAARGVLGQLHAEPYAAGNDPDLQRPDLQDAHLGDQAKAALLGNDQELAVGVEENPARHRSVGQIEVRRHARAQRRRSRSGHGHQPVDEVLRMVRRGGRVPSQPVWRWSGLVERP